MHVRRIAPPELEAAGDVAVAAYTAIPLDVTPPLEASLRGVATRNEEGAVLVAVDDGQVIGTVTYVPGPDAPSAEFEEPDACGMPALAVAPSADGRGGRALVNAIIELGRKDNRKPVILHTTPTMRPAQELYQQMGFDRDQTIDWFPTADLHLMGYRYPL